ncbi:MAG: outer membrane beta-barrel protein [Gammaproteobacteria bacterium]|nr:outer membrane beta-barrel protein [Gammaproteobacteria bacterium]
MQITRNRKDDITSAVIRYTYKFPQHFDLYAQYFYSNHHSNIARQDYLTKTTSVGVDYRF